jgi:hypothetical protein
MGCCPWIDTMSWLASEIPGRLTNVSFMNEKDLNGLQTIRFESSISILLPRTTKGKFSGSWGDACMQAWR